MIPAGHERTRRNLHDTWALRRSQPLVPLGFSGLLRTLGAGSDRVKPRHPPFRDGSAELSTVCPPTVGSAGGAARRRIERGRLSVEAGQDQAATEQVGRRHDVGVGDPPGDGPVGFDRERLDLGLDDDVGESRRARAGRRSVSPSDAPSGARRSPSRARRCGSHSRPPGRRPYPSGAPAGRRGSATRTGPSTPRAVPRVGARPGRAAPGPRRRASRDRSARRPPRTGRRPRGPTRCRPSASAHAGRRDRRSLRSGARRSPLDGRPVRRGRSARRAPPAQPRPPRPAPRRSG